MAKILEIGPKLAKCPRCGKKAATLTASSSKEESWSCKCGTFFTAERGYAENPELHQPGKEGPIPSTVRETDDWQAGAVASHGNRSLAERVLSSVRESLSLDAATNDLISRMQAHRQPHTAGRE